MSDPVSNVEIEDVLSSIRRLVSDENRPVPKPEPEGEPYKPTRLVLTPSLLVPESTQPEYPDETPESSESMADADYHATPTQVGEQTDEAFDSQAEPFDMDDPDDEPDQHDDLVADTDTDIAPEVDSVAGLDLSDFANDEPQEVFETDATQTPWSDPAATLFKAAETAEIAETDHAGDSARQTQDSAFVDVAGTDDLHELPEDQPDELQFDEAPDAPDAPGATGGQDVDEPPEFTYHPAQDDRDRPEDELRTDELPDDADEPDTPDTPDAPDDDDTPYNTATLSAKIAALEAKIGQTSDQWEPDGELGDDYAGTRIETIQWQDHDAADTADTDVVEPDTATMDEPPETIPQDDSAHEEAWEHDLQTGPDADEGDEDEDEEENRLDIMAEDEAILDEESLRELVADIVRQELQGALGERITRNVRKLVRREIHRALTAQELD